MFTWDSYGDDESSGDSHNREIDFEDSTWGFASAPNTQVVVRPWYVVGNIRRYFLPDLSGDAKLTRIFFWQPSAVRFLALHGDQSPASYPLNAVIDDWSYLHNSAIGHYVPPPGRERVRFNLWLNQTAPASGQPIEVVVTDFKFEKLNRRRGQVTSQ